MCFFKVCFHAYSYLFSCPLQNTEFFRVFFSLCFKFFNCNAISLGLVQSLWWLQVWCTFPLVTCYLKGDEFVEGEAVVVYNLHLLHEGALPALRCSCNTQTHIADITYMVMFIIYRCLSTSHGLFPAKNRCSEKMTFWKSCIQDRCKKNVITLWNIIMVYINIQSVAFFHFYVILEEECF